MRRETVKGKTAMCRVPTEPKGFIGYWEVCMYICMHIQLGQKCFCWAIKVGHCSVCVCVLAAYKSIDNGPAATASPGLSKPVKCKCVSTRRTTQQTATHTHTHTHTHIHIHIEVRKQPKQRKSAASVPRASLLTFVWIARTFPCIADGFHNKPNGAQLPLGFRSEGRGRDRRRAQ